jgi:hypothetical protein
LGWVKWSTFSQALFTQSFNKCKNCDKFEMDLRNTVDFMERSGISSSTDHQVHFLNDDGRWRLFEWPIVRLP